jgi:hypothetical protein
MRAMLHHLGPDGDLRWSMPYLEPGSSHPVVFDLVADPAGGFIAGGHAGYGIMNAWAWAAKFDANRNVVWSVSVPGDRWYNEMACVHADYGNGIAVAPGGRVVLTGMLDQGSSGNAFDAFVAMLEPGAVTGAPPPVSDPPAGPGVRISASGGRMPAAVSSGDSVVVRVPVSSPGRVRVEVYSLLWERVRVVYEGDASGPVAARWDGRGQSGRIVAPGTYLIRVEAPGVGTVVRRVSVR